MEFMLNILQYGLLLIFSTAALYYDLKDQRIPNKLVIICTISGIVIHTSFDEWSGLLMSLIGCASGMIVLLVLYFFKAVGAGDVKFFGAIGALVGMDFTLYCMMYSLVYAGFIGLLIILFRKEFSKRMGFIYKSCIMLLIYMDFGQVNKEHLTFPFMIAVLPAAITTLYFYSF
jgi:prepilin peptidase CpaA